MAERRRLASGDVGVITGTAIQQERNHGESMGGEPRMNGIEMKERSPTKIWSGDYGCR
jgi:hypothetical protein